MNNRPSPAAINAYVRFYYPVLDATERSHIVVSVRTGRTVGSWQAQTDAAVSRSYGVAKRS